MAYNNIGVTPTATSVLSTFNYYCILTVKCFETVDLAENKTCVTTELHETTVKTCNISVQKGNLFPSFMGARRHGQGGTYHPLEMLKSVFVLQKIASSLLIGHHQKRSLRFKFAIAFGGRTH